MSYIDLATLALHRRNEMETRITSFVSKCDQAIENIMKLKFEAQGFVNQLNCDPALLKERFLHCMRTLDEYTYLITDFNLAVGKLDETKGSIDYTPVHDVTARPILIQKPYNILDILSEPTPTTSTACPNFCPLEHKPRKKSKDDQTLIVFSSTSCSNESMPMKREKIEVVKKEMEVQDKLIAGMKRVNITDPVVAEPSTTFSRDQCNLPAQTVLEIEHVYQCTIMNIDRLALWVITEDAEAACQLMQDMTLFYKKNHKELPIEKITSLTNCAFYDEDSDCYYRALFLGLTKEDMDIAEVFLVDTGEVRYGPARASLQFLAAAFCVHPPFARCCHFAGVDIQSDCSKQQLEKLDLFMAQYVGTRCTIEVDDNTSESLGIYVILPDKRTLNELLIQNGLAFSLVEKPVPALPPTPAAPTQGPPELARLSDSQLDLDGPEYDDPVEAVTGYSCRDEADICKHYKGGPEKTCFKGARCTKKHILKHPDGWTMDKMEVMSKCRSVPLPAPRTWQRVLVTCVAHFDRLFVQLLNDDQPYEDALPDFGVILPPSNLEALVKDMNSPATKLAYKPLKIMPAPGELVAALYPLDEQWYRARVLTATRADQNVEVMYIDYGNVVWVGEDAIRLLDHRFLALPAQAMRCALAGVIALTQDSRQWAAAKKQLAALSQDRTLDMHVISRGYDEITVEMFDENGYSIAERLAELKMVALRKYDIVDDTSAVQQRLVVVP